MPPQAVGLVGFKATGVAAGTMAAGWQASIGKDWSVVSIWALPVTGGVCT